MESFYAGWLSVIPPIVAIALALITKEVVISLFLGIISGTVIYCLGMGLNPVVGSVEYFLEVFIERLDVPIIVFCFMLGAVIHLVSIAGGAKAYGRWAVKRIKTRRSAMLSSVCLSLMVFVDDYFNCLTIGTVMRPVTDKNKVSRAKLSYLLDSTAAPICIIAPVSTWAVAVGSNIRLTNAFESDLGAFIATIPFNLYALFSLVMVFCVVLSGKDYGPMAAAERRAQEGELGATEMDVETRSHGNSGQARVFDMILPIASLIVLGILGMLHSGGFWGPDPAYHNIIAAFGNCESGKALVWGSFGALFISLLLFVPRKLLSFQEFMAGITNGMRNMVGAATILVLAWTISGVCNDLLLTAQFVSDTMAASNIPSGFLPAIVFLVAAFLSFATGTSWGTFSILIPIIVPVAIALNPALLMVSLSATLAGSVFGDHCSPISDTTILASTGANCNHLQHVGTQIFYAVPVAIACFVGYLVAGFTDANLPLIYLSTIVTLAAAVFCFAQVSNRRERAAGAPEPAK